VERRDKNSARPHLRPLSTVDSVCTLGMALRLCASISTLSRVPTPVEKRRGLFCAQLLPSMLDPLTKAAIARHLAAHFVYAMNHRRVIPAAKGLTDFDELHFQ
jgi:hypothetical protein